MNYENIQWVNRSTPKNFNERGRYSRQEGEQTPKFRKQLTENVGRQKQLVDLIAAKRTTTSSYSRPNPREPCFITEQVIGACTPTETSLAFNQCIQDKQCEVKAHLQDVSQSSPFRRRQQKQKTRDPRTKAAFSKVLRGNETLAALNRCIFQDNLCDKQMRLQDVSESSLLRKRRQNQKTGAPKTKGEDVKTIDVPKALKLRTFQDNQLDVKFNSIGEEQSSLQNQKWEGPETDTNSPPTSFQDKANVPSSMNSPRNRFDVLSSLEDKIVIQSPPKSPCERTKMLSLLQQKSVIHSPRKSPSDHHKMTPSLEGKTFSRFEMVSSLEEEMVMQSPLTSPYDRFEMVSSVEERIVIFSSPKSPCDRIEMVSSLGKKIVIQSPPMSPSHLSDQRNETLSSLREKTVIQSPLTSPYDHFEMVSSLEQRIVILSSPQSPCERIQLVSSLKEKTVIQSPLTSPRDRFEMVSSLEQRIVILSSPVSSQHRSHHLWQ